MRRIDVVDAHNVGARDPLGKAALQVWRRLRGRCAKCSAIRTVTLTI